MLSGMIQSSLGCWSTATLSQLWRVGTRGGLKHGSSHVTRSRRCAMNSRQCCRRQKSSLTATYNRCGLALPAAAEVDGSHIQAMVGLAELLAAEEDRGVAEDVTLW